MKYFILLTSIAVFVVHAGPYTVTTWVGNGTAGSNDGTLTEARLNKPVGLFRDKDGIFYVTEWGNNKVRKITPEGVVTTIAGTGVAGHRDGPVAVAQLNQPFGVCVADDGTIYIGDFGSNSIRKISTSGSVSTVAGGGGTGYQDGAASSAKFYSPRGVDIDNTQNCIYVGDSWNHRVRKIDLNTNQVSTYAGGGSTGLNAGGFFDAQGDDARFQTPCGIRLDSAGNVYVADAYTHRIRKVDADRNVTTIAGSGSNGQDAGGYKDGDVTSARFNTLTKLYVVDQETFLVADLFNHRIRLVADGEVTTLAGTGNTGYKDGADSIAQFDQPRGIYADADLDSIYVCDCNNHCIRLIWRKEQTEVDEEGVLPEMPKIYLSTGKDILSIELSGVTDAVAVEMYALNGKLVYQRDNQNQMNLRIPLQDVNSGMYLVRIVCREGEMLRKLYVGR